MTSRRPVIGVMGAGDGASREDCDRAEAFGRLVAERGWVVLTGGRDVGVMEAAGRGAKAIPGSLVLGILPGSPGSVSAHLDIAVFTGLGNARNAINVLSSDVVVACGKFGSGTASEVALALKSQRPVVLLAPGDTAWAFFSSLDRAAAKADTAQEAVDLVAGMLQEKSRRGGA